MRTVSSATVASLAFAELAAGSRIALASRDMTRPARLVAALVACTVLVAMLGGAAAAPAPSGEAVQRAVERVFGASGYQREMPDVQAAPLPSVKPPPDEVRVPVGDGFVTVLLAGVLAIVLIMLAMRLFSGGWAWSKAANDKDTTAAPGEARSQQRVEVIARLDDADQAAADGDWARAIHILLLTSIERLRRQTGQGVPVALTARELLDHLKLGEQARGDLAALVGAAELCHFGGRSADRDLYARVRTHYERLWQIEPQAVA